MQRRNFLKTAGALAAAGVLKAAAPPPNLLIVLASGWRGQALPGDEPVLRAPNLARLAQQSARFNRYYVASPLAGPSRATLITGRYPHACGVKRNDVRLPLDQPSIAQQLKDAGYQTGYIGEWALDGTEEPGFVEPGPRRHGFGYWAAFNRGHHYFDSVYFRDTAEPIHAAGFEPDYQTTLAIDFLKQHRQDPFFLHLCWGPPSPPRTPPGRFLRSYELGGMRLRPNVPETHEGPARPELLRYYALCSALDENVGRLMRALEENDLRKNTIVVFTSDQGDMLGSQGLSNADAPFEESVRVPLILRYPGLIAPGRRDDALLSSVDLMPTLLGMCGAPIPEAVQGADSREHRAQAIYSAGQLGGAGEWRMVVRGLDKIVVDRELSVTHLYNLGQDPYEMQNLAQDKSLELKRDELHALLKDWMRRTGDRMDPSGLKKRA